MRRVVGLIIIIMMIMIIAYTWEDRENYETLLSNVTDNECGNICTEGLHCMAFGYKPREGRCYLSRNPIYGRPLESKYKDDYSKLDKRCNKINMLTDRRLVDDLSLTQNSVYVCTDGEIASPVRWQYAKGGSTVLDRVEDRYQNVPERVSYKIEEMEWI